MLKASNSLLDRKIIFSYFLVIDLQWFIQILIYGSFLIFNFPIRRKIEQTCDFKNDESRIKKQIYLKWKWLFLLVFVTIY